MLWILQSMTLYVSSPDCRCFQNYTYSCLRLGSFTVKWDWKFNLAIRLTFECRSSPHVFYCLSEALCWILLNVCKLPFILYLLFLLILLDTVKMQASQPNKKLIRITKRCIYNQLSLSLFSRGLSPLLYTGHSFRIEAASNYSCWVQSANVNYQTAGQMVIICFWIIYKTWSQNHPECSSSTLELWSR